MAIAGKVNVGNWVQVAYEGRDKNINALRKAARAKGMRVASSSMGPQVTPVGTVTLRMMTIFAEGRADELTEEIIACNQADVFNGM